MSSPNLPDPLQKLPKLRRGITFSFGDYDIEGKPQWIIQDTGRNKFFIIGWVEYEILERWHLGQAQAIIDSVNKETTLHIDKEDIIALIEFLTKNYLIQQSGYQIYRTAKEQKLFRKDSRLHWLIEHYLFFRVPLVHPDRFLGRTLSIGKILFNRYTAYVMACLGVIALYQVSTQWAQFTHSFSSIFTLQGLIFSFIAFTFCKLLHELGHAYMCKSYGIPVPTAGVAFLVFWPVLYTDTTLSWQLNNKQRMRIALAGIWVETYVTIFAALIWANTHNLTLQAICYVTITVNWLASVLINVSPFMRFDGYYVLADALKMPNLQFRAFALTRWQIRRWLFHWQDPPPERFHPNMHYFLIIYSILTWIYRLFLYLGIALLVYHFFIKVVGILLFAIEIYYFIISPILSELKTWVYFKDRFSFNTRTKMTIFGSILLLLLFFLPINESIKIPATLSYSHAFLIAPEEGIIAKKLPSVGTSVKAGEPIIYLNSVYIDYAIKRLKLEYQKKAAELRRAALNPSYSKQKNILLSEVNQEQSEYQKLLELKKTLTIQVPFDGKVVEIASELTPGTMVMKGEWLGDVIRFDHLEVEAFATQEDLDKIKINLEGYFYPEDLTQKVIPVKLVAIEALNASKLNCSYATEIKQDKNASTVVETPCYHASDLGGKIPTTYSDQGQYVPVESVYRLLLVTDQPIKIKHIERGSIILNTESHSYASELIYKIKSALIKQTGF